MVIIEAGPCTVVVNDPRTMSDEQLAEGVVLHNVLHAEQMPRDDPLLPEVAIGSIRATPARHGMWSARAHLADGLLVAAIGVGRDWDHDDNPEIGALGASVHPDHRGKGIGSVMMACQVGFAKALGRTRLLISTTDRYPLAAGLAERMGAVPKQHQHINELQRSRVDRAALERWVADAGTRSAGYELIEFDGPVPDGLAAAYVQLLMVMNTAPRDGLEVNDFTLTVDELRENEERSAASHDELWCLVARHRSTGQLVGLHNVGWNPTNRKVVYVGSTGVEPAHRGFALGKWLKAAMTLRILDERHEVTTIRTENADSNDAMLGINRAMGYEPTLSETTWEISRDQAEQWLCARGVGIPDLTAVVDAQRPDKPLA